MNLLPIQKQKLNKKQSQMILVNQGIGKHWTVCCPPGPEYFETSLVEVLSHTASSDYPHTSFERDNYAPLPSPASPSSQLSHRFVIPRGAPVLIILYLPGLIQFGNKLCQDKEGPRNGQQARFKVDV